ncbi:type II toxin-antitoxin system HicA family toxin [Corticibacterium sp. UT-5YL-CI-8]|nr:type II toxin-antitoxin system HicA family toxin [Tianweitania sp. UT-5YL-CI-8]
MPPRLTVRDVLRLIEADGWYLVATRGSHRQYKHEKKPAASPWPASFPRRLHRER